MNLQFPSLRTLIALGFNALLFTAVSVPAETNCYGNKCLECVQSIGPCTLCENGLELLPPQYGTNPVCGQPAEGCANYDYYGICGTCQDGLMKSKDGKSCHDCSAVSDCHSCEKGGICSDCAWQLAVGGDGTVGNQACVPEIAGCVKYSLAGACQDCDDTHTLLLGGCLSCDVNNCDKCNAADYCEVCKEGFHPSSGKCLRSVEHCAAHNAAGECSECDSPYLLSSDQLTCNDCSTTEHCARCDVGGLCSSCSASYALGISDSERRCVTPLDNCNRYTIEGKCTGCLSSYSLNSNGECVRCNIISCEHCEETDKCTGCSGDWNLSEDQKACNPNIPGCVAFNVMFETCTQCKEGLYTPKGDKKSCNDCSRVPYCTQCELDNTCTGCDIGKVLVENGKESICVKRISRCTTYSLDGTCKACESSYSLSNNVCQRCPQSTCAYCDGWNHCARCNDAYMLDSSNTCQPCPAGHLGSEDGESCIQCGIDHCAVCSEADQCKYCKQGYTLSDENTCEVAMVCQGNTVLSADGSVCVPEIEGCSVHEASGVCSSCANPLKEPSLDGLSCVTCTLSTCDKCSADGLCAKCLGDLVPSTDKTDCVPCAVDDCDTCLEEKVCHSCMNGFSLANSARACVATMLHCNVHGLDSCLECEEGYDPSADGCVATTKDNKKDDDDGGVPWWVWLIVGLGAGVVVAGAVVLGVCLYMRRRRAAAAAAAAPFGDGKKKGETASQGFDYDESNEPLR